MTLDSLSGSISDSIDRALSSAGLDPHSGMLKNMTDTIRRSLEGVGLPQGSDLKHDMDLPRSPPGDPSEPAAALPGSFSGRLYRGPTGSRNYKLYVPVGAPDRPLPMVVMLHGCKQNPDDFAAGTRMNELADRHGFLVAYPAQSCNANGSNCWNWFQPNDQERERGEPSIIAGIVREIAENHAVDAQRVFVAGLSAGASMAVIVGATHPELFRAVGAHSGLARGAAHDVGSAFGAMHGGGSGLAPDKRGVPTIVFQGDADGTVVSANADAVVRQALGTEIKPEVKRRSVRASGGKLGYSTTVYADPTGRTMAEKWIVKGGAHTWFGGSDQGSYTDAKGPDASAEMVRFFLAR